MNRYAGHLLFIALYLASLACRSPVTVETTITCGVEGFTQATDNTYLLYQAGVLDATIEYKDGLLSIYNEPGHERLGVEAIPQGTDHRGILQRFDLETGYLIKEIDIVVACDGVLFVRERIIDPPQPPSNPGNLQGSRQQEEADIRQPLNFLSQRLSLQTLSYPA